MEEKEPAQEPARAERATPTRDEAEEASLTSCIVSMQSAMISRDTSEYLAAARASARAVGGVTERVAPLDGGGGGPVARPRDPLGLAQRCPLVLTMMPARFDGGARSF